MNNKEDLLKFVKDNWRKIPYLCNMPEEGISEFIEKGTTSKTSREHEILSIDRKTVQGKEFFEIASYILGLNEYEQDEYFLTSHMSFEDDGTFKGVVYGNTDISFSINERGEVEFHDSKQERNQVLQHLIKDKTVVTHFGDDLDNKASIYAIESFLRTLGVLSQGEKLKIERVPAGKIKEGYLNVDTGGHVGNRLVNDTGTIIIDGDPKNGIKSACQSLSNMGIYIPEQIYELADAKPIHISALDSRSGLALVRYLSGEQTFRLAEHNLLDKSLTDKQLDEYDLVEAHAKQQQIIDTAVEKINKYTEELPNGEKIVLSPEQITAGSSIAYEMGIPYYASTTQHFNKDGQTDGVTFAISCKPGTKLPDKVLEYGKRLVEQYRIDERTSGVFVNPNGQLIVAGGPKNPDFKIEGYTPESMLEELRDVISSNNKSITTQQIGQATIDTPTAEKQEVSQAEADEHTDEHTKEEKEGEEVGDDN